MDYLALPGTGASFDAGSLWGAGGTYRWEEGPGHWRPRSLFADAYGRVHLRCMPPNHARPPHPLDLPYGYGEGLSGRDVYELLGECNDQLHWLPTRAAGKGFPDVPDALADTASEAHRAMQTKCYRVAVLLARSVIEATAKAKKAIDDLLSSRLTTLLIVINGTSMNR